MEDKTVSTYGNESYAAKMAGRRNRLLANDSAKYPYVPMKISFHGDTICQMVEGAISKALHPIESDGVELRRQRLAAYVADAKLVVRLEAALLGSGAAEGGLDFERIGVNASDSLATWYNGTESMPLD